MADHVVTTRFEGGMRFTSHLDNHTIIIDTTEENGGEEGGYVLERKTFDRGLALRAEERGAKLMIKTRASSMLRKPGCFL